MGRKVDGHQTFLVRAGAGGDDDWELWAVPDGGKTPQLVQRLKSPRESPVATAVALPAQHLLAFPCWVASDDREIAAEVLRLRLEQSGLVGRTTGGAPMVFRLLTAYESRSLAVAMVLQPDLPEHLVFERAVRFEPSAFALPLLQDRLTAWREGGRLTFAITRGSDPVYVQTASTAELNDGSLQELNCIFLQLEGQGLIQPLLGAVLWGDFTDDDAQVLRKRFGFRVTIEPLPGPRLPAQRSSLLPAQVEALHARKRRRDRVRRLLAAVLVLYLGLVASVMGYMAWERTQIRRLEQSLAGDAPTVRAIQGTADRWRNLQWAVDPHVYPVELLNQISSLLPPQGMHLTAFELQKGKVIVRGEASTAPAAFKFAEDIKGQADLQMFTWQMPSPSLRPDGRAEFTIEGEPKFAKTN
jgi:hypothetical protein